MSYCLTERDFNQQICDLARLLGWEVNRTWLSIHSPAGFPDLVLIRENDDNTASLIFAELKAERGKLTEHQAKWLALLSKVPNIGVYVWYPQDFDRIALILQG